MARQATINDVLPGRFFLVKRWNGEQPATIVAVRPHKKGGLRIITRFDEFSEEVGGDGFLPRPTIQNWRVSDLSELEVVTSTDGSLEAVRRVGFTSLYEAKRQQALDTLVNEVVKEIIPEHTCPVCSKRCAHSSQPKWSEPDASQSAPASSYS